MKYLIFVLGISLGIYSCNSGKATMSSAEDMSEMKNDTIRIANEELEYEIIILEQGFDRYMSTQPPESYYSVTFLERKNQFYVMEYNRRVQDIKYSRILYPQTIEYNPNIRYGLEVNYLLYHYFQFFETKYKQRLL
ncbi:DUF6146 family protein [Constantimarinum furrinae]|uniref:Lipoprotein n=1 Tax=Constantimarinum furrinae TaxID=2562285 RepID=A0A7G8PWD1_9FLAO|nr:DUF6146 family protein [Constantimarinum furrinae]QNJ98647.1 hypothetical protein ALE3EI_2100 [Constantimarinum furrinae]